MSSPEGEGFLDKVEEFVDDVLAEDLAPEPEGPWERRQRVLDSWTAVILGLAAVATTWVTFQASQWAEVQANAQATSAILRSDANRAASDAVSERIVDSQMWLSWLRTIANDQPDRASFYRDRFSPALDQAHRAWRAQNPQATTADASSAPDATPFDLPEYQPPAQTTSDRLAERAESELARADEASGNANRYVLMSIVFALSLFFGSVATKFSNPKQQVLLVLLSLTLLIGGVIRSVLLPLA